MAYSGVCFYMNNDNITASHTSAELGGTTNLSLDQLKKEKGTYSPLEENPDNIEDRDDLHEIRVGDDLNEPDAEDTGLTDDKEQPDDNDKETANPTELNS